MTPDVASVLVQADHQLLVEFADGARRRFSMAPYLQYPAYAPLKDEGMFHQAKVQNGTVVWSEEIDISPDTLYLAGSVLEK